MPSAEWRRSRTVNVHDELWDRIHRAYLAAAQASAEHVSKSEFLEEVFEAGLAAVAARLGLRSPAPPAMPSAATPVAGLPESAPAPAVPPPPARSTPAPEPPPAAGRRKPTAEERRAAAMERLRRQAAAPLHPPAIPTAAARPGEEEAAS